MADEIERIIVIPLRKTSRHPAPGGPTAQSKRLGRTS